MRHMSNYCYCFYYFYHEMLDFFPPQFVKFKLRSSIDQRKIEFVRKSKVTNNEKGEEVNFLFIYYFKNFGTIDLVS